jgi:hypothetical protein
MTELNAIPSHSPSVVTRKTGNEYVLVPVTGNIADMDSVYTLNETGAFIWDQIDGKKTLEDLIRALTSEYETDYETAKSDMLDFVTKMKEYLILEEKSPGS